MPGEEKGHYFVTQLAVSHLAPVVIVRLQEHRKQISLVVSAVATFSDYSVDDLIYFAHRSVESSVCWSRKTVVQNPFQRCLRGEGLNQFGKYSTYFVSIIGNIRIEQGLNDNLESETQHVGMNIARLSRSPFVAGARRVVNHNLAVAANSLPMKSRLGQTSLTSPEVALTGYQAIADKTLKKIRTERHRLAKVSRVGRKDLLDIRRVVDEVSRNIQESRP